MDDWLRYGDVAIWREDVYAYTDQPRPYCLQVLRARARQQTVLIKYYDGGKDMSPYRIQRKYIRKAYETFNGWYIVK